MGEPKKRSRGGRVVWWAVFLMAVGLFIFAAYHLITIYLAYKQATDEYNDLRKYAVIADDGNEDPDSAADSASAQEDDPGPVIDFAALKAINEEVIGWVEVEALDISYPIVHTTDNDYYLHRTIKRTYNFAGSIFLETKNKPDFNDCNSIVYGHNMKNGSMFGSLKKFRQKEVYESSMYFWICTPEKNYKYEIFSAHVAGVGGDVYTLFDQPDEGFVAYMEKMKSKSEIPIRDMEFKETDKVVTFSTCTGDSSTRFVVQGVRIK